MNHNRWRNRTHDKRAQIVIMMRRKTGSVVTAAVVAAAGAAIAACATTGRSPATAVTASGRTPGGTGVGAQYSYYRSMMGSYFGDTMMGGGPYRWMMTAAGYRWMTGITGVPGWMRGRTLPPFMMAGGGDPGTVMGRLWAGAPGPRISPAQAAELGSQIPHAARVNRIMRLVTFTTTRVRLAIVAGPPGGPDDTFRIAGLVNPGLVVPAGAHVSIEFINADPGAAHGLVITARRASRSWMPMMTARPIFTGSALWFLGDPTSAGMHAGTLTFTATTPGAYQYLCPVPGHARKGMAGTFTVTRA